MDETAFAKEFWQDDTRWPAPEKTTDGKKIIFLLGALRQLGMREKPDVWPKIDQIYRRPELFVDRAYWDRYETRETLHRLLYRYDYSYQPNRKDGNWEDQEPEYRYEFTDEAYDLAAAIARFLPPVPDKHDEFHADALGILTKEFASGRIETYFGDVFEPFRIIQPLPPKVWNAGKEKTDKRFVFGQIETAQTGFKDDERGDSWIYVDEEQFTQFLNAYRPRELTEDEYTEKRFFELDADPKGGGKTAKACYGIIQAEIEKKYKVKISVPRLRKVFQRLKPRLIRLGKRGEKAGTAKRAPASRRTGR